MQLIDRRNFVVGSTALAGAIFVPAQSAWAQAYPDHLNRAAMGSEVVDFNADKTTVTNTGHFIIALDVARFVDPAVFAVDAQRQLEELRTSARLPGIERIRLPGDDRAVRRRERASYGVPLSHQVLARLDAAADGLGVARLIR